MATSIVSPTQSTSSTTTPSSLSSASAADSLTNEETFLKLLVAQIQNQDPLNPADGIQFLTQLTGFSQLEQLMQINQELAPQSASGTSSGADSSTTNSNNNSSTTPVG